MPRLFVSAAHKSSGKTMITLGLARALRDRGRVVQPFKKGPDYIDPLWLSAAAGRPCYNLDYNVQDETALRALVARHEATADLAVIEGTKGLYDGVALDGSTANAALAKLLGAPVVLVVDCVGMTRGVAPLLLGYRHFTEAPRFAGVILNKVGGHRHESKVRAAVETYTDFKVLGAVPVHNDLRIAERHLGLIPSTEQAEAEQMVARIAAVVADHVDLGAVEAAALDAAALPAPKTAPAPHAAASVGPSPLRVAVARDAAFAFYYPDDLDALTAAGVEIVPLNTLEDPALPAGVDALILGGGFPETQMASLEANVALRADIRRALRDGLPCYAECGGLMYLSRRIRWKRKSFAMVGLVPGDAVMHDRPRGRGYVRLEATDFPAPWRVETGPDGTVAAHEFHYSALEDLDAPPPFAYRVLRGDGIDGVHDGLILGNTVASYTHMRGNWVRPFVDFVRSVKVQRSTDATARGG